MTKAQGNTGSHIEVDLTSIHKYSFCCSVLQGFQSQRKSVRSATITCRDHVSRRLLDEVALCPLVELSLDLQPCRLPTRELVEGILHQTRPTLKTLKLQFGILPCFESSLQNHATLQSIDIRAKSCTVKQWERLVLVLGTCEQLRAVKLYHSGCLAHNHNLLKHSLVELVALPKLENLELVNIPTIGIPIFQALGHANTGSALRKLVITTHRWGFDLAIQTVANMLGNNSTLQDLTISAMDWASLPIFQALKLNRSLKRLELCRGSSGALPVLAQVHQGLVELLRENHVLQEVLVSRREWPHADVASYLTLNRVMQETSPLQTRQEWLDAIIDHRQDVRVVQFLLTKNPTICIL